VVVEEGTVLSSKTRNTLIFVKQRERKPSEHSIAVRPTGHYRVVKRGASDAETLLKGGRSE
jgi:hypothetical protein